MPHSFGLASGREDQCGMGTQTRFPRQNSLASNYGYAEGEVTFDLLITPPTYVATLHCGISTSVVRKLPKLERRVRLPYPAPPGYGPCQYEITPIYQTA